MRGIISPTGFRLAMKKCQFSTSAEILFWKTVVRVMSNSSFAQGCLLAIFRIGSIQPGSAIRLGLAVIGTGMLVGILSGLLDF